MQLDAVGVTQPEDGAVLSAWFRHQRQRARRSVSPTANRRRAAAFPKRAGEIASRLATITITLSPYA